MVLIVTRLALRPFASHFECNSMTFWHLVNDFIGFSATIFDCVDFETMQPWRLKANDKSKTHSPN